MSCYFQMSFQPVFMCACPLTMDTCLWWCNVISPPPPTQYGASVSVNRFHFETLLEKIQMTMDVS